MGKGMEDVDVERADIRAPQAEKGPQSTCVVRRLSTRIVTNLGQVPGNLIRYTAKLLHPISWPAWSSQGPNSETSSNCETENNEEAQVVQIEDFPLGYPRFSAFIAALDNFQVFRRFSHVRTRLLLLKQDRIAELEEQLNEIDRDEPKEVFRATRRGDKNKERKAVVEDLEKALESFDNLLTRAQQISALPKPHPRNIKNIENWLDWNPCVAREETEFLSRHEDLLILGSDNDQVLSWMDRLVTLWLKRFRKKTRDDISRDDHVHIFHRDSVEVKARLLLTPVLIVLLLTPVVICDIISNLDFRLIVIIVATSLFITVLSVVSRAKTVELAVAGST